MTAPLFGDEGPQYYAAAYAHNAPFATGGPYFTALAPPEEKQFRAWVAQNRVPFDVGAGVSDYDMRGYWKANKGALPTTGERGMQYAWPDTFKTPYDTTFSRESRYAMPNCPFVWQGDSLVDMRNGQLIFGPPVQAQPRVKPASNTTGSGKQYFVRHRDGSLTPIRLVQTGPNEWYSVDEVPVGPGEQIVARG